MRLLSLWTKSDSGGARFLDASASDADVVRVTDQQAKEVAARKRLSSVVAGSALMLAGVVLVLVGCWYIGLGWALCENNCPAPGRASWLLATLQVGVAVVPGLLVGGGGWLVLCWPDITRSSIWAGISFVVVALVAWLGTAFAISDPFPPAGTSPPADVRTSQQQAGRDLTPDELRAKDRRVRLRNLGVEPQTAADRAAHPIPESKLRQAERTVEARMQRNYSGSTSDIDCIRTSGWRVSCAVNITDAYGAASSFEVPGRYRPRLRAVDFRPW
jgi:hypothetical protein